MRTLRKLLIFIVVAAIFSTIGYFYWQKREEQNLIYQEVEKYNAFIKLAREEKELLQKEANKLYGKIYLPDLGSTTIVLSDTRIEQKEGAIALMEDYDFKGVVALSLSTLPEDNIDEYMNSDDIDELIEAGYELVIKIINEDITRTYQKFIERGYDIKGFYFEGNNVGQAKIDTVKRIDPNLVIIGTFENGFNYVDDLLITAYGSAQSGVKTKYEDAIDISKPIALTVGYDNSKSQYSEDNFEAMLKNIRNHVKDDTTKLCTVTEAIEAHDEYIAALKEEMPEEMNRLEEIKQRIEKINTELSNIGE